jgi:hypothetical protein
MTESGGFSMILFSNLSHNFSLIYTLSPNSLPFEELIFLEWYCLPCEPREFVRAKFNELKSQLPTMTWSCVNLDTNDIFQAGMVCLPLSFQWGSCQVAPWFTAYLSWPIWVVSVPSHIVSVYFIQPNQKSRVDLDMTAFEGSEKKNQIRRGIYFTRNYDSPNHTVYPLQHHWIRWISDISFLEATECISSLIATQIKALMVQEDPHCGVLYDSSLAGMVTACQKN